MFGSLPWGLVGDFRVLPIEDVSNLGPVAESNVTRFAGINVLDRNLNPCSFIGWTENIPDLPFRNRDSCLVFGIDHFDHFSGLTVFVEWLTCCLTSFNSSSLARLQRCHASSNATRGGSISDRRAVSVSPKNGVALAVLPLARAVLLIRDIAPINE